MVVKELLQMRAPPILILVVVLTLGQTQLPHHVDRDFCELFSGQAEVTKALRHADLRCTAMDITYDPRIYDLTSPSGFTLALNEALRCREGSLFVLAPCCKSFSRMSRHTAGRTFLCPYGFTRHNVVEDGNVLATRCILLLLVAAWRKLRFLLEQPHGSCMEDLPEFQWLLSVLQVWTTVFYMGRFSGPSPKRHKVWSNEKSLLDSIFERAGYMSRVDQQACSTKLVKSYTDSKGVKRVVGLKDQLRGSQHYTKCFGQFLANQAVTRLAVPLSLEPPVPPPILPSDLTDVELFRKYCMPLHKTDLWARAKMRDVAAYLGACKYLKVSDGWEMILQELFLR